MGTFKGQIMKLNKIFYSCSLIALTASVYEPVDAQSRSIPADLALARICVSEAGWSCFETGDGYGIHEVLLRGSERESLRYTTYARSYAGRVMGARPHEHPRLLWVMNLRADGGAPAHWPTTRGNAEPHAPWSSYRQRWVEVLSRAREVVTFTLDDIDDWGVCDDPAHDWGGWMDRERAARIGLLPVQCGDTRNDFYSRPSLNTQNTVEIDVE